MQRRGLTFIMSNKASIEYWNNSYKNVTPYCIETSDPVREWMVSHIPTASNNKQNAIEIGCYPGRYLSVLGDLGYELFGIDRVSRINEIPTLFKKHNYKIGSFWNEDFLHFKCKTKFDVVFSAGFIEHFTNWEEVFEKHCSLVKDNGLLVIETPNFIGKFQLLLHTIFDKNNLSRHHIPAMEINDWEKILKKQNFEIIQKGFFGKIDFWNEDPPSNKFSRICLKRIKQLLKYSRNILPENKRLYSPFIGIIAKKRQTKAELI